MGKYRLFLTELSARNTSVFYFQDNNLSKFQWIFTKFDICIYIVELCFGIAYWQISTELPARDMIMTGYYRLMFYFIYKSPDASYLVSSLLAQGCRRSRLLILYNGQRTTDIDQS